MSTEAAILRTENLSRAVDGTLLVDHISVQIRTGDVVAMVGASGAGKSSFLRLLNAMNTNALALDRFRGEVESHVGQIEAALALGAGPQNTVAPYVQAAVQASLIPRIDSLRSLGIVWIPGLMAGMVLSGEDPVYAAIYQFAVIAMIFAAAGLTSVVSTLLIRSRAFSPAQQLRLRPGPSADE